MVEIGQFLQEVKDSVNREKNKLLPPSITHYAPTEELKSLGITKKQIIRYQKMALREMKNDFPDIPNRDAIPIPGLLDWSCSERVLESSLSLNFHEITVTYQGKLVCVTGKLVLGA